MVEDRLHKEVASFLWEAYLSAQGHGYVPIKPISSGMVLCIFHFLELFNWGAVGVYQKTIGDRTKKRLPTLSDDQSSYGINGSPRDPRRAEKCCSGR